MIGNLYTEEEVKQLLKDVLHTDQTDIERFYYPDGTTSGFDQDEFNTWFDKHKKPENSSLGFVSGSLPIEFLEWAEKGMWTKYESRNYGYHEMAGWYNTHNFASMIQPLTSKELFDLFMLERSKK